jgi:hypothetical protein
MISMQGDGIIGSGQTSGLVTLDYYAPGHVVRKNVMAFKPSHIVYPSDNFYPDSFTDLFVNYNDGLNGNYRLVPDSPYKNAGTDGRDVGANIDAIYNATLGVVEGISGLQDKTAPSVPGKLRRR